MKAKDLDCEHCGGKVCRHDGAHWIAMCSQARAWSDETHVRWEAQHKHPLVATMVHYHGAAKAGQNEDLR